MRVTALYQYPVKSCAGQAVPESLVERQGLAGDRRWMLVDAHGRAVTAREQPRLVLVRPEQVAGGLRLSAPGQQPVEVVLPSSRPAGGRVGGSERPARCAGPGAEDWFSRFLGAAVRLVHQYDPASRPTDPAYSTPQDRVSLADGFPLLLATEESLAALNDWLAEDSEGAEHPLDMRRFRPNVVVQGAPAWTEDGWRRVRLGAAWFRMVKPCARCVLTTIDPDTGVRGREPLRILARRRRFGTALRFAVNLVPDTVGAVVRVGDEVEAVAATGQLRSGSGPGDRRS